MIEMGGSRRHRQYFVSIPDNEYSFYAYLNLVINNKGNAFIPKNIERRPRQIGPVEVSYTHNEVGEPFIEVNNLKDAKFLEMIVDQFILLRTHWNMISSLEQYPNASRY